MTAIKIYQNSIFVESLSLGGTPNLDTTGGMWLSQGSTLPINEPYIGALDELSLYNYARTASEILGAYNEDIIESQQPSPTLTPTLSPIPTEQPTPTPSTKPTTSLFLPIEALIGISLAVIIIIIGVFLAVRRKKRI